MFALPSKTVILINGLMRVILGNEVLETYFCPGHYLGHIIFFNKKNKLALVGDVLF